MLNISFNDKIVKIEDNQFSKPKLNSIKIIIDKYGIKNILDFKLTFKQDFFSIAEDSAEVILNKSVSIEEFFEIMEDMFSNMGEDSDDIEDITISFEGLFI